MKGILIRIVKFIGSNASRAGNGGSAVAVRKGIPNNPVDSPPLFSVKATGVFIPVDNS
jgi:hypothetical protein